MATPTIETPVEAPETQPQPQRERARWWTKMPWPKGRTRNAAPLEDDRLLLANRTDVSWSVHVGFRELIPLPPQTERQERVVKSGQLTARPLAGPGGADYLTVYLHPTVEKVEIRAQTVGGQLLYDLRLLGRGER